jgi:hypothetical protein
LKRWGRKPDAEWGLDVEWGLDKVKQARRSVKKVRLKLLSPTVQAMDSSAEDLGAAVESLKTLEAAFTSGRRLTTEWRRLLELEMGGLRRELREISALLEGAGKFYEGWARLASNDIDDAPAHYSGQGMPLPPVPLRSGKVVAIG